MSGTSMLDPFHDAERAVQQQCGTREQARVRGALAIRAQMPEQHQRFFESLPMLFVASLDKTGHPHAQVLTGAPGFVQALSAQQLRVQNLAPVGRAAPWQAGAPVGLLGLDFSNGRRNRANGVVQHGDETALWLQVTQSFGNCPRHITLRRPVSANAAVAAAALAPQPWIAQATTFFIASRSADLLGVAGGLDLSHRGGPPGFVQWQDAQTLCFDDYPGNGFFNTLGNIRSDARVGLLFVDWDNGHTLHVRGRATLKMTSGTPCASARQVSVQVERMDPGHHWPELRWPTLSVAPAAAGPTGADTTPTVPRH
jgi:uncharacterized protein